MYDTRGNNLFRQYKKMKYTKEGTKALGGKKAVAEWERVTGNKKLPKRVKKSK